MLGKSGREDEEKLYRRVGLRGLVVGHRLGSIWAFAQD